jgi:hypothetical protein
VITSLVFIAVGAAGILLWLSHREIRNIESRAKTTDTHLRHAPKPSPAVSLNGKKSRDNSSVSVSGSAGKTFSKQWPSDGMQMTAHHKGRHGCKGILTLKASGLQFTCPDDDGKSFFITLNDIRGPDDDGIITLDGSKYHFDMLPGGGKEYTEQLFAAWLSRVRVAPLPHQ